MGYYSYMSIYLYKLNNKNLQILDKNYAKEIIKVLRETSAEAKYALQENGECDGETKWYKIDEDLCEFSLKYPDVVFLLEREGESKEDMENSYFFKGKKQNNYAKIIFDDFDPEFFGL